MYDRIAALVVEDMDVDIVDSSLERWATLLNSMTDLEARRQCGRQFDSFEELSDKLSRWYDKERIRGWRDDGRVFEKQDGTWWSGISPLAHVRRHMPRSALIHVCCRFACTRSPYIYTCAHPHTQYLSLRFIMPGVGKEDWNSVGQRQFPIWLLIAGQSNIVQNENLKSMGAMVPRTRFTYFPDAKHNIHNPRMQDDEYRKDIFDEYIQSIEDVYLDLEFRETIKGNNNAIGRIDCDGDGLARGEYC